MKNYFLIFLFFATTLAFGQSVVGDMLSKPMMGKFEAEVITDASKASTLQEAREILARASNKSWAGAPLFFNLANVHYQLGNYKQAIKFYKLALEKHQFFQAYKNLAIAYDANSEEENARETFAKVLAISGNSDTQSLLWLANYRSKRGDYSSSLAMCNQALIYRPDDENIAYAKCVFLCNLEIFAEAEKFAKKQFEITKNKIFLRVLIKSYLAQNKKVEAIASLELARNLNFAEKSDLELLGNLYFSIGVLDKALSFYEVSKSSKHLEDLALAAINCNDLPIAEIAVKKLNTKSERYEKIVGIIATNKGDYALAEKSLQKFLKSNPNDFEVVAELAEIYYKQKDFAKSSIMFSRLRADKNFAKTGLYGLLRNSMSIENYTEALRLAREISAIYDDANIKRLVKNLEKSINELEESSR